MIKHSLLVYIERLREGKSQIIKEELEAASLELEDEELTCKGPISVLADAYLAGDWLVVNLSLNAQFVIPCSFCNEPFVLPIKLEGIMHEESLEAIRGDVFDILPLIRETLLLEVPYYPLCGNTTCLRRDQFEKYMKSKAESHRRDEEGYQPFKNL